MNNLIPKNKLVVLSVIVAVLSVVLYFTGLFIVLGKEKKIEDSYFSAESESSKEERIRVIKYLMETNKEPIQELQDYFVQKDDEVKFIEQIEKVARNSGIKAEIISIDVKANQNDSFKENVDVKMKVDGSWHDIMYFINKLEKISFGVLIENLNLDSNTPNNWSGLIELIVFREK